MRRAAYPGLYDVQADRPTLLGTTCAHCGRVYFPPLSIGCEVCGAPEEKLRPTALDARGTIHSLAQVHLHRGRPPAPFIIAEIQLDAGPLIRATLAGGADFPQIGDKVLAIWTVTATSDDGAEIVEPLFSTARPATAVPDTETDAAYTSDGAVS
jgi:hypothetical protein